MGKHGKCVYKDPCFQCPTNSHEINSRFCGQSFQDNCKCDHGYEMKHGKCVKECYNDFHCPSHSARKHNRKCYDSFDDCECDHGYEKKHGKCVVEEHVPKCYTRYIAYLDSAVDTQPYGALELDEQYRELNFVGEYRNLLDGAALEGHKMHIHSDPVATQGDCASTGGHYDPAGVEVGGYNCDPEHPSTCYVGDITGKFGKVYLDGEETTMGPYRFDIEDVLGRGVVLHDPDTGARIACGTIEEVTVCE